MKNVTIDREHQGFDAFKKIGANLLADIEPKLRNADGSIPELKNYKGYVDDRAHLELNIPYDCDHHIDIFSSDFTVTYDLGESKEINTVFVSGFTSGGNYMIGEFGIYIADSEAELYNAENEIAHVSNEGVYQKGKRSSEVFVHIGSVVGSFFGIKVTEACATDDIARIGNIEAYSDVITRQLRYLSNNGFENNALNPSKISADSLEGDLSVLTDGKAFMDNAVKVSGKLVIDTEGKCNNLLLLGKFGAIKIYTADSADALFETAAQCEISEFDTGDDTTCISAVFDGKSQKYVGVEFQDGSAELDELGIYNYTRNATIETANIRNADFYGIGGNELPMAWMPESREKGFLNVYWPIYEHRIIKSKPSTLRFWFQVDWIVDNEADYMDGKCNFNTAKMKGIYKYLDAYEKAGIEVNLNFGWKASTEIQDWFSIPHTGQTKKGGAGRSASAPKNIDGFAKCCAALVRELCVTRGYKCVKHLTFYNESGYGDYSPTAGDFLGYYGHSLEMWEKMIRRVDEELKAQGLSDCLDFWVPEISGRDETHFEWLNHFTKNCSEFGKMNTFHRYRMTYNTRLEFFEKILESCNGQPAMASEFAVYDKPSWERSNVEYAMSMMHAGLSGGLYWIYQGVMITDPTWLYLSGDARTNWWCPPYESYGLTSENIPYHEFSLFTHYIPRHSKVLNCLVDDNDIRVEAVETPDGNYTVLVENKSGRYDKEIELKFDKLIGKTFRKHVYRPESLVRDGNLTVPPCEKEIEVLDTLCDTLGSDYCFIAYTTLPNFKQVKMDKLEYRLTMGEKNIQLGCELIDCEGEIEWSIASSSGPECSIDQNGVFTPHELCHARNESCGDLYCVKAQLKGDPMTYGVAMVRIIP